MDAFKCFTITQTAGSAARELDDGLRQEIRNQRNTDKWFGAKTSYVAELEAKEVCKVRLGKNQFTATVYEISDRYWPYHRTPSCQESPEIQAYVESVRECFEGLGCTTGKFDAAEIETARQFQRRAIPFGVIHDAMLLGACRKLDSWLNGGPSEPIRSMAYFEPLIAEIQAKPLPAGYSAYLGKKIQRFSKSWQESVAGKKEL